MASDSTEIDTSNLTSKELVRRALAGLPTPRPATGPLAVHYCAALAGISLRDYTLNPRLLADAVIRYYERFRPDAIWLSADTWVTAQAMGAAVAFPGGNQPMAGTGEPCVRTAADIARIPPPDPGSQGRWPLMLEALRLIKAAVGSEAFLVACFDQYPFSLACSLLGIQQTMTQIVDDRSLVVALMEKCATYTVAYALALAEAGADMLSGGDSPAGLIGPTLYRQVALPFERQVIFELKSRLAAEKGTVPTTMGTWCPRNGPEGALHKWGLSPFPPVSLHICGNAMPILRAMASSGADVLELDHQVDLCAACRTLGPEIAIWGNLDPVALLAQGTPDQIRRATRELVGAFASCGHRRYVVSSGCTLALETPPANVEAMLDVVGRGT